MRPWYALPQFERTLIVAEEGSYVSYLEGCTAPAYDQNQVRVFVVRPPFFNYQFSITGFLSPPVFYYSFLTTRRVVPHTHAFYQHAH